MNPKDNHLLETIKAVFVPLHRSGWMFVAIFAVTSLILGQIWHVLGWIGLTLTAWCAYFFRDPDRVTPVSEGMIVSPADGVVQSITNVIPPAELELGDEERMRVSIFMNVFDVHVNRVPYEGTVTKMYYIPGKYLNASLDKASEENERQLIKITLPDDKEIGVVQIAGMVARRILCDLEEGQSVKTGERFGIIRFGSRVDVYLPKGTTSLVIEGQRSIGGETLLADLNSDEPPRVGVKH